MSIYYSRSHKGEAITHRYHRGTYQTLYPHGGVQYHIVYEHESLSNVKMKGFSLKTRAKSVYKKIRTPYLRGAGSGDVSQ